MAYKGKYVPKNPSKYLGDPTKIIYRSSWERKLMVYCDMTEQVLTWGSEEVVVNYVSPIDGKVHRYFVDFVIEIEQPDKTTKVKLIEVKPKKQCSPPKPQQRVTRKYINEVKTWGVNSAKWESAKLYAEKRGWEFVILTEDNLFA
jgi:hypothetical protein